MGRSEGAGREGKKRAARGVVGKSSLTEVRWKSRVSGWGEIPPLFGGLGHDKTAQSAQSVPELSNTTVGGWQTPCSGDPDRTASPCRRSRFQNSPVRSATVVTATDLAQGNLKAERGRPAISSLVGDRHGHMDCRENSGEKATA